MTFAVLHNKLSQAGLYLSAKVLCRHMLRNWSEPLRVCTRSEIQQALFCLQLKRFVSGSIDLTNNLKRYPATFVTSDDASMSAPPPSSLRAAKQALRKEMRGHLKAITEDSLQQQGRCLASHLYDSELTFSLKYVPTATATTARLLALPAYTEARRLSVYLTMPKGELRTDEIVKHALSHGKDVFVPFTKIPEQPDTMKMLKLRSLQDFESLQPNAWKIPEHETAEGMQEGVSITPSL